MEGWYAAADAYMKHFIRIKILSTGRKGWNAIDRKERETTEGVLVRYTVSFLKASLLLFYFHGGG